MPWCCVFGCSESGENDGTLHMHRFPSKDPIKRKWVVKCYRSNKFDYKTARVCSRHFDKKDYVINLKYEQLCLPIPTNQIKILEDALPSLCLPPFPHRKSCFGR